MQQVFKDHDVAFWSIIVVQKFVLAQTISEMQLQIKKRSRRIAEARPMSDTNAAFSAASDV